MFKKNYLFKAKKTLFCSFKIGVDVIAFMVKNALLKQGNSMQYLIF